MWILTKAQLLSNTKINQRSKSVRNVMFSDLRMLCLVSALMGTAGTFPAHAHDDNLAPAALSPAQAVGSMQTARDSVLPNVVSILVVREDFSAGEARLSLSGGTGTIVRADGYVATNAHVTDNGKRFKVVLNDSREFPAVLVGVDAVSDLAVLKIVAPGVKFSFSEFSNDLSELKPGDEVIAMGAPWGMRDSLSKGVINNVNRLLVSLFEDEADYEQSLNESQLTARYYAWIQHDASISPGNSGGPLVDMQGRVVGVNTRGNIFGGDMAFSIPAPIARKVVDTIIADGAVTRSDFGFGVRSLRGSGFQQGALVSNVDRGSNAERVGLKPGDRILKISGAAISLVEPEDIPNFRRTLAERPVGSSLDFQIIRAGKTLSLKVKSVEQIDAKPKEVEVPNWGISVVQLTPNVARTRYFDSTKGVLVQGMRPGGPGNTAQPALQAGDRITHVNQVEVRDLAHFEAIVGPALLGSSLDATAVSIKIDRQSAQLLSLLTPAPKRLLAPSNPELDKAWAGWEIQPVPATLAKGIGYAEAGFRITRIYPDSPAAKAKLVVGDLITATNGIAVKPSGLKETSALDLRVRNAEMDQAFKVSILRAGAKLEVPVKLSEEPLSVSKAERRWNERLSLTLRALTYFDRMERKLKSGQNGVVLERVESGGFGGLAHLREADLLVSLSGRTVSDLTSFDAALAAAEKAGEAKLSFLVMRGTDTRLLFVDAPWREVQ
jgi:S1-C subfamily serine protease